MSDMQVVLEKQFSDLSTKFEGLIAQRDKVSAEEKTAFDTRIKGVEEAQKSISEALAQVRRLHIPGTEGTKTGEKNKFSVWRGLKVVTKFAKPGDKECGYEEEVFGIMRDRFEGLDERLKTAINASSGASGAFLISTEINNELIPELEAKTIATQLGMKTYGGLTSNVSWNRDLGGIQAYYIDTEAEEAITESKSTFGNMEMRPHVVAGIVSLTWGMLNQPAMAMEPWIRGRLSKKIAIRIDKTAFLGISASSEPRGLKLSGIPVVDWTSLSVLFNGSSQTFTDALQKMIASLPENNVELEGAKLGWATGPFTVTKFGNSHDSTGRPLLWPTMGGVIQTAEGRLRTVYGYPIRESTQLNFGSTVTDTEDLYFGDFSQLIQGMWGTMAFASSDVAGTNFATGKVSVRGMLAHDIGVLQPLAFIRATNIKSATGA